MTSVHSPYDPRILQRECRTLADAGYEVVLLAPHTRDEIRGGVRIRALPRSHGRVARMTSATGRLLAAALEEKADYYHFHDPELLPVGLALSFKGKRVIYDAHEDVPRDIMAKDYLPMSVRRILAAAAAGLEWSVSKACFAVVGATPTIAERFPATKAVTVQNFPRLEDFPEATTPYTRRPNNFVYVGSVTQLRGGVEMVQAMARLRPALGARLVLCGKITPQDFATRLQARSEWECVDYRGWCDPTTLSSLFEEVRAGLVLLHPTRAYHDSYPGKMFEYMASGLPVIASDFPLWRRILEPLGAGILVDPSDPIAISDAMTWILENQTEAAAMGVRGREAVRDRYNWGHEALKLLSLYERGASVGGN
jgi:glycosyltransferase involved in cell wall biosynthesis